MSNIILRLMQIYPAHPSIVINKRHEVFMAQSRSRKGTPSVCKNMGKRNWIFIETYFERYMMIFSINALFTP